MLSPKKPIKIPKAIYIVGDASTQPQLNDCFTFRHNETLQEDGESQQTADLTVDNLTITGLAGTGTTMIYKSQFDQEIQLKESKRVLHIDADLDNNASNLAEKVAQDEGIDCSQLRNLSPSYSSCESKWQLI